MVPMYMLIVYHVGRKLENAFYWPQRNKDQNWYEYQSVHIISEPTLLEGTQNHHFKVDFETWNYIVSEYKKA